MPDVAYDNCQCGRPVGPAPHCPTCGSTNVYSRDSSGWIPGEPIPGRPGAYKVIQVRGFRCRRCRRDFNEMDRCYAPQKRTGRVAAEKAQAKLDALTVFVSKRQEILDNPQWSDEEKRDRINALYNAMKDDMK